MIRIPEDKQDHINDLNDSIKQLRSFLTQRNPISDAKNDIEDLINNLETYVNVISEDKLTSDDYENINIDIDYAFGQWSDAYEAVKEMQHKLAAIIDELDTVLDEEYEPDEY